MSISIPAKLLSKWQQLMPKFVLTLPGAGTEIVEITAYIHQQCAEAQWMNQCMRVGKSSYPAFKVQCDLILLPRIRIAWDVLMKWPSLTGPACISLKSNWNTSPPPARSLLQTSHKALILVHFGIPYNERSRKDFIYHWIHPLLGPDNISGFVWAVKCLTTTHLYHCRAKAVMGNIEQRGMAVF
jgi:hypothetical protein